MRTSAQHLSPPGLLSQFRTYQVLAPPLFWKSTLAVAVPVNAFGLRSLYLGFLQLLRFFWIHKLKMPLQIAQGVGGGSRNPLSTALPCCLRSQSLRQRPNQNSG